MCYLASISPEPAASRASREGRLRVGARRGSRAAHRRRQRGQQRRRRRATKPRHRARQPASQLNFRVTLSLTLIIPPASRHAARPMPLPGWQSACHTRLRGPHFRRRGLLWPQRSPPQTSYARCHRARTAAPEGCPLLRRPSSRAHRTVLVGHAAWGTDQTHAAPHTCPRTIASSISRRSNAASTLGITAEIDGKESSSEHHITWPMSRTCTTRIARMVVYCIHSPTYDAHSVQIPGIVAPGREQDVQPLCLSFSPLFFLQEFRQLPNVCPLEYTMHALLGFVVPLRECKQAFSACC